MMPAIPAPILAWDRRLAAAGWPRTLVTVNLNKATSVLEALWHPDGSHWLHADGRIEPHAPDRDARRIVSRTPAQAIALHAQVPLRLLGRMPTNVLLRPAEPGEDVSATLPALQRLAAR